MHALGRYELLHRLARGGMADVYLARRRVAGVEKRLVIKRLRRERTCDPRLLELFVREAQLSMGLVQQNIVPVFDFGRVGDDLFLAMEHIDGLDLGTMLRHAAGHGLPPMIAAFIAAECCQALRHAHAHAGGVVHRDVSPRNVLVAWAGEVKLADFGIAAVRGDAHGMLGTPAYVAPEQARGEATDARADLFALGLVLWEALAGQRVRTGDVAAQLAQATAGVLPPVPTTWPPALQQIVATATAAQPAARYENAQAMWRALDAYLAAARGQTASAAPAEQLAAWLVTWRPTIDAALPPLAPQADEGVSTFLDDGAAGIRDNATQRSLAETAGPGPAPPPVRPARRRMVGAIAAVGLVVVGGMAWRWWPGSVAPVPTAAVAVAAPPSPPAAPTRVVVPIVTRTAPPTNVSSPLASDSRPGPSTSKPLHARHSAPAPAPPVLDPAVVASPPVVRRPVTLGATPWANVTVDDDPTVYETPVRLELTTGPHRVRFANPELAVVHTITLQVPLDGIVRHVEPMTPAR